MLALNNSTKELLRHGPNYLSTQVCLLPHSLSFSSLLDERNHMDTHKPNSIAILVVELVSQGLQNLSRVIKKKARVAVTCYNDVTSRLKWNTPELHAAQPLDYLSQFPWIVSEANTRYTVNHTASAMLPIP